MSSTGRRWSARVPSLALVLIALAWAAGCGRSGPKNSVSGKVLLEGRPVAGTVAFIGPDGKEALAPINPDGTYTVANPPAGQVRIVVRGILGVGGAANLPPEVEKLMPAGAPAPAAKAGVPPPERYATPDSGLTFNVTKGKQKHDITLEP
jgi:hypothetical protein